jgi:hypothetical protein
MLSLEETSHAGEGTYRDTAGPDGTGTRRPPPIPPPH